MEDIDLDIFAAAAVVLTDAAAGAITAAIAMGDFRVRSGNRVLHRRSFDFIAANLNEVEFKRAFRMSFCSFHRLRDALAPKLQRNEAQGARSSAGSIDVASQLGIFLRTLAGAQYIDIMLCFGVSRSTVYQV
eukprot:IDg2194t1